jgi:hypothetical protein
MALSLKSRTSAALAFLSALQDYAYGGSVQWDIDAPASPDTLHPSE